MEKSKRVFITKLQLGLPLLLTQQLRRGARNSGLYCLYRVFSREKLKNGSFQVGRRLIGYLLWKGKVLGSDWFSFPGLAMGSDWFPFPGLNSNFLGRS